MTHSTYVAFWLSAGRGVHVVCRYIALAVTGSSVCFRALLSDLKEEEFTQNKNCVIFTHLYVIPDTYGFL